MSAPDRERDEAESRPPPERVGDALRTAVERTLAASAGSASETRQRARELLDELVKRGELARDELGRRGEAAREEVSRRGEAAREDFTRRGGEASRRLTEAIGELRPADRDEQGSLDRRVAALERRIGELERARSAEPLDQGVDKGVAKPEVEGENSPEQG